jgi:hypothetical protein
MSDKQIYCLTRVMRNIENSINDNEQGSGVAGRAMASLRLANTTVFSSVSEKDYPKVIHRSETHVFILIVLRP